MDKIPDEVIKAFEEQFRQNLAVNLQERAKDSLRVTIDSVITNSPNFQAIIDNDTWLLPRRNTGNQLNASMQSEPVPMSIKEPDISDWLEHGHRLKAYRDEILAAGGYYMPSRLAGGDRGV